MVGWNNNAADPKTEELAKLNEPGKFSVNGCAVLEGIGYLLNASVHALTIPLSCAAVAYSLRVLSAVKCMSRSSLQPRVLIRSFTST